MKIKKCFLKSDLPFLRIKLKFLGFRLSKNKRLLYKSIRFYDSNGASKIVEIYICENWEVFITEYFSWGDEYKVYTSDEYQEIIEKLKEYEPCFIKLVKSKEIEEEAY